MSVDPDMAPELEAIIDHEHSCPHQPLVEQRQPIVLRARTTAITIIQEIRRNGYKYLGNNNRPWLNNHRLC